MEPEHPAVHRTGRSAKLPSGLCAKQSRAGSAAGLFFRAERRCLLQITDAAGAVEELPLELRGNSIPPHKHGRAQALPNLLPQS
jgi:hypothetical protein